MINILEIKICEILKYHKIDIRDTILVKINI